MKDIILASASPRRRELLTQIGVVFQVQASDTEEIITTKKPEMAVEELSFLKCRDVYEQSQGNVVVIGADTVVAFQEEIFGKPASEEEAFQMLEKASGKNA